MKKGILVLALAVVLVLAFSTTAMAKYAGYLYNVEADRHPGYLSWDGALNFMTANGVVDPGSPHGGYVATTTKCAVCHSAHRAATDATVAGVGSYWKLTPGSLACTACHTPSGSNPTAKLVEWPSTYSDGGPHSRQNCMGSCHSGVHGGNASEYGAMNAFLLNPANDAAIAAAFAAGNESGITTLTAGGSANEYDPARYALINEDTFRAYDAGRVNVGYNTYLNQDRSTMRAMATGYTCGASGCHSSSQFAVNKNGYAEERASNPGASTSLDTLFTGHLTNTVNGCAPCHSVSIIAGAPTSAPDSKCATCHDMVGAATNTTAFPHANRNIVVREKSRTAASFDSTKTVSSRNLWMYYGDATWRDTSNNPTATADYAGNTSERIVLENATVSGGYIDPDNRSLGSYLKDPGDIRDGVCMKCHGYEYWAIHSMENGHGTYGGREHLQFSRK